MCYCVVGCKRRSR